MGEIKGFIFDMDGVIFDTENVYLKTWKDVFKRYGYDLKDEVYISVMGTGRKNVMKVFKEQYGEDMPIEEMYKLKDELLFSTIDTVGIDKKNGAEELLGYLKEKGYKIALGTSAKRNRVKKQFRELEVYFDYIVTGDDVVKGKPNPEIFLKCAKAFGVSPEQCVVIEDSLSGIKAASNAGMIPFHVEDLKKADKEIETLSKKCF